MTQKKILKKEPILEKTGYPTQEEMVRIKIQSVISLEFLKKVKFISVLSRVSEVM